MSCTRQRLPLSVSVRAAGLVLCLWQMAALGVHIVSGNGAGPWALRLAWSAIAMALVPGAVLCLHLLPYRRRSPLEIAALSFAWTMGLVQLLTIVSLLAHVSVSLIAPALLVASAVGALLLVWRNPRGRLEMTRLEAAFAAALVGLGVLLYGVGVPQIGGEDYVHIGIIRRLAALPAPALDNISFTPGILYTYPFPAIHYLLALIARSGAVDALFVYSKSRFLWGPVAMLLVWACARVVFRSRRVATASGVVALILLLTGSFAALPDLMWGQLVPFTHASDIAMGLLLPATLLVVFEYFVASGRTAVWQFFAALTLAATLAIVHIRELVQVLVYLGAFLMLLLFVRGRTKERARAAALIAAVLVVTGAYVIWYTGSVSHVESLVAQVRADLVQTIGKSTARDLARPAASVLPRFIPFASTLWWGVYPVLLIGAPLVAIGFRRRPLVWLMAASLLAYVVIVRVTPVAAAYIYATYFEILFTPARNFAFFLHIAAGALIWILARATQQRGLTPAALLMLAAAVVFAWGPDLPERIPDVVFLPAAAGLLYACSVIAVREGVHRRMRVVPQPFAGGRAAIIAAAAFASIAAVLLVAWTATASIAPIVNVRWRAGVTMTDRATLERRFAIAPFRDVGERTWAYELLDSSRRNVAAIVRASEVEDTNDIDRSTFEVAQTASRGQRLGWPGVRLPLLDTPAGVRRVVLLLALVGFLALCASQRRSFALAAALLVVMLAAVGAHPEMSPTASPHTPSTPARLLATITCRDEFGHVSCPPTPDVIAWIEGHVPVNSLLVSDAFNQYPTMMFVPQQSVGWTGLAGNFLNPDELFGPYMPWLRAAQRRGVGQPLFNEQESRDDRRRFVDALNVGYVLVDPPNHALMTKILTADPLFERVYDRDEWSVYRVVRTR